MRRQNNWQEHDGKRIDAIWCVKDEKSSLQAMRYPRDTWTAASARSHCGTHDGTFEAAASRETSVNDHPIRMAQTTLEPDDIEEREEDGQRVYRITAFASQKARGGGPQVSLKGLSLKNHKRNPVLLWAHDSVGRTPSGGLPIGRVLQHDKDEEKLRVDFRFNDRAFSQEVKQVWDAEDIRAASIAWLSLKRERVKEEEKDGDASDELFGGSGWIDVKSDLLEISLVPVPADPGALRDAYVRSLLGDDVRESVVDEVARRVLEMMTETTPDRQDSIEADLAAAIAERYGTSVANQTNNLVEADEPPGIDWAAIRTATEATLSEIGGDHA